MSHKIAHFILGTNGSGKTTYYNNEFKDLGVRYINSDLIARDLEEAGETKLSAISKSSSMALSKISDCIKNEESFLTESTFSSDGPMSTLAIIKELKRQGYEIKASFLGTDNLKINFGNIRKRVSEKRGHFVDRSILEERFEKGLELISANLELFDELAFVDNSEYDFKRVAGYESGVGFTSLEGGFGWLGAIGSNEYYLERMQDEVLKVSKNEGNTIVSLKDGGVVALLDGGATSTLIDTVQVADFKEALNGYSAELVDNALSKKAGLLSVSKVESVDIDEYTHYKNIILSDGMEVSLNTHGVLVDNESYFTFEEFVREYKDKLDEDTYFEFNKYCVKQDAGDRLINPFNLDVNDIKINDIVTALSGINRFAGQTKLLQEDILQKEDFYTVGQHTLAMYDVIKNNPKMVGLENASDAYREKLAKMALLHESFEGITGTDLITPFKYATKKNEYKIAEVEAEAVMEKVFGMPLMTAELKRIDKAMAATEGYKLVGNKNVNWSLYGEILPKSVLKTEMSQAQVKNELAQAFEAEGLNANLEDYRYEYNLRLQGAGSTDKIFAAKVNYLRGKFEDKNINYSEDNLLFLAKQRFKKIGSGLNDDMSITLENSSALNIDKDFNVRYFNWEGNHSEINLDDFMISQRFSDLTRLDYFENKENIDQNELVGKDALEKQDFDYGVKVS